MASSFGSVGVDTHDLAIFLRQVKKANPALGKDLRLAMKAAGNIVAEEARKIAAQYSGSIPPTIRTEVRGTGARVAVRAGGNSSGYSKSYLSTMTADAARYANRRGTTSSGSHRELTRQSSTLIAGLYELGNKGGSRNPDESGTFRHPIYGTNRWVAEPRHAYLRPAARKKTPEIEVLVMKVAEKCVRTLAESGTGSLI